MPNIETLNLVWNTGTLSWEKMAQPILEAGNVTVSGTLNQGTGGSSAWKVNPVESGNAIRFEDAGSNTLYLGEASAGTLNSAASWRVSRIVTTSPIEIKFADGDDNFNNIWDNRASLNYV